MYISRRRSSVSTPEFYFSPAVGADVDSLYSKKRSSYLHSLNILWSTWAEITHCVHHRVVVVLDYSRKRERQFIYDFPEINYYFYYENRERDQLVLTSKESL